MATLLKGMKQQRLDKSNLLDWMGASLSLLCLAHCILVPLLPLFLALAPWMGNETVHSVLLFVIAPVAFLAFPLGLHRHGKPAVIWCGALGLVLLISATLMGETLEKIVTVLGSLVLCVAHFGNRSRHSPE